MNFTILTRRWSSSHEEIHSVTFFNSRAEAETHAEWLNNESFEDNGYQKFHFWVAE